jgi:DNA processing protein
MSISHEELKSLLVLNRLLLGGAKAVHRLLWEGLAPSEILGRIQSENFLQKAEAFRKLGAHFSPEAEIEKAGRMGVRFLTVLEPDYPALLKHITDPPLVLYIKGSFCDSDAAAVAMVGTRHPSFYGKAQARVFARGLAEKGITVVSGLAQGIDQASHEAALEISHGRTIAVLGCGLDLDYPRGSRKLREKITERGAVISEYAFGGPPCAENFPRRNRIIAGLSRGVLVVEAHAISGSLITARLAAEEGRDAFAVPGPVDQITSRGTHHLIKEGAALVETPEDILQELGPQLLAAFPAMPARVWPEREETPRAEALPQAVSSGNPEEERLLESLGREALFSDEIAERSALNSGQVVSLLTRLELERKVQKTHDGRFSLAAAVR